MVRKVMTYVECDRCEFYIVLESPKGLLRGYKMAHYPEDWKETDNGPALCPKCKKEWQEEFKKFMAKGARKVQK